jgi:hypothetical protein
MDDDVKEQSQADYDKLANSLALCLARCAEHYPPLLIANCVFGTADDGLRFTFSCFVPSAAEEMEPMLVELIEEYKQQGLTPSGAIRFLIPGAVIERSGIRDSAHACINILAEVTNGKTALSDSVAGLPMTNCGVVDDDFRDQMAEWEV